MNSSEVTVILSAGRVNPRDLPLPYIPSVGLVPVNGRPAISILLDDLLRRGLQNCVVVLREDDGRLAEFLDRSYRKRMQLVLSKVAARGTILDSVQAGLETARSLVPDAAVRLLLGDTLIPDELPSAGDYVCVKQVEDSERWCLARFGADAVITELIDKPVEPPQAPYYALAGFYRFADMACFAACVGRAKARNLRELSAVLQEYMQCRPLMARLTDVWFDFGHIDGLVEARRRLLRPRFFNDLAIDPVLSTITKRSHNEAKLANELAWYEAIPDALKALTPRILSHRQNGEEVRIVQEYYGYPSLAELFVFGDLHRERWESILRHLFRVHDRLAAHQSSLTHQELRAAYELKTTERLEALAGQDREWVRRLDEPLWEVNGCRLIGLPGLRSRLNAEIGRLCDTARIGVLHGDYCFSNILFDLNSQITRLIDPRGSFGRQGIYGDVRYDLAKLRHSACGHYDFIVADMFTLSGSGSVWEFELLVSAPSSELAPLFDRLVIERGLVPRDVQLIEGLLFLTMPPLHSDQPRRQMAMFLTALKILNSTLL
jgi:dTDP-glucose pyrophosphorylase